MVAAVALRKENSFENQAATPSRGDVLARYRHMREISKRHHSNVMDFLSKDAIMHHARRLVWQTARRSSSTAWTN